MNNQESNQNVIIPEIEKKSSPDKCVVTGIYGLRNKINDKWYIGYSKNIHVRWNKQYKGMRCKNQPKLFSALKKHGYDAFEKIILEECSSDVAIWGPKEVYWIAKYNSIDTGYNIARGGLGGDHSSGRKRSDAFKKNLSKKLTGIKRSEEFKQKVRDARAKQIIRPMTAEEKVALGLRVKAEWASGKRAYKPRKVPFHHSEETKQKIREKHIGMWAGEKNPNHRKHGSPCSTGRVASAESIAKRKETMSKKTYVLSDESRQKMSDSQRRRVEREKMNHPLVAHHYINPQSGENQNIPPQD